MNSIARLHEEWHDGVPVARLDGEVDASNASEIGSQMRALLTNRSTTLIVDLTAVSYLDSAGINLLFSVGDELRARQQALRLVIAQGTPIARMLAITSLDRAHPTFGSLADAVAEAAG
jgi:anti-anti-sigma factor